MTNFDPTTNRIPFCLLTPEEREALLAWPHGWEYLYSAYELTAPMLNPANYPNLVSRGKPAPKKTTYYCNVYDNCIGFENRTIEACKIRASRPYPASLGILQVDIINDTPTFTFIPKDKTE
jgi:hypothetical protein